jgi:dTDP-4-amino-4,6-dideoxygalactose transaminase
MLRDHGRKEKYLHETLGLNFRMSEIHAAIGRQQLKHLPEWIEKRRHIAGVYNSLLRKVDGIMAPMEKEWARHVYHLYVIRVENRDRLRSYLSQKGVATGIHYPIPVHQQPCMKNARNANLPVTEKYVGEVLSLPMHPHLKDSEVEYVSDVIKKFMGG